MDFQEHLGYFLKLLDNSTVAEFLKRDTCGALCDKYHFVIIFQYFMRAEFKKEDYTIKNFFLALTLSHDLYDESKTSKQIILSYYMRKDRSKCKSKAMFHWEKVLLFQKMQFKGFVEKKVCQRLCQLIRHRAFYKHRKEIHTGIVCSVICDKCKCPINKGYRSKYQGSDESGEKMDTSSNIDVSDLITEQKAKRPKKSSPESSPFFSDNKSDLIKQKAMRPRKSSSRSSLFFSDSESDHFRSKK